MWAPKGPWAGFLRIVLLIIPTLVVPGTVSADSLTGSVDLIYTSSNTEERPATGQTIQTETKSREQQYRLNFDKTIYPNLMIRGGGFFDIVDSTSDSGGTETETTNTFLNPFVDMTLRGKLYNAGAGYNRIEAETRDGSGKSKLIRETRTATLGWKPVNLPSLDLRYTRNDAFDPGKTELDSTTESYQLDMRYRPVRPLELSYSGVRDTLENRLTRVESENILNSGKISYADMFLKNRVALSAFYNISDQRTESHAPPGGELTIPVNVTRGFSAVDDTPENVGLEGFPENQGLINGDLTGSAGINIGPPSLGDPQGMDRRNLGLELQTRDQEVNGLLVWVNRQLSVEESNYFQWEIYVSQNNLDWTSWRTVRSAPFGPIDNRFEVRFPSVRTPYIKVAVVPLSRTLFVGAQAILVTELQATLTLPAAEAVSAQNTTYQSVNLTTTAQLLTDRSLHYNFYFFYSRQDPTSVTRMSISNWLTLQRRLNQWLNTTLQVARDDTDDQRGKQYAYRYSAAFYATPLRYLSQTIIYSGNTTSRPEGTTVQNSLLLSNRAMLYPGISVTLNGAVNDGRQEAGRSNRSYLANLSSTISPHPTMTWTIGGSANRSKTSGGNEPETISSTRRGYASVSWNPRPALNLYASGDVVDRDGKKTTRQSWSINWSPFQGGALQVNLLHTEEFRSQDDGSDKSTSAGLRWDVRPGIFTDLTYGIVETDSRIQEARTEAVTATLHANF